MGAPGLPGPEKQKKAKVGHNQFQKGQIFKLEKRPNFQGYFAKLCQMKLWNFLKYCMF